MAGGGSAAVRAGARAGVKQNEASIFNEGATR